MDDETQNPPTTHFVATVDDLTDMLDFDSEDIDGMDDDAGDDQELAPTGHWKATSTHDVYMMDTPKESDNKEQRDAAKDNSPEKQQKRRRKRRPKSRLDNNGTHTDPAVEQGEPVDEQPIPGKNNSPDDLTPDTSLEHKNLHRRLDATTRSLKKQKRKHKTAEDVLRMRWSKVL